MVVPVPKCWYHDNTSHGCLTGSVLSGKIEVLDSFVSRVTAAPELSTSMCSGRDGGLCGRHSGRCTDMRWAEAFHAELNGKKGTLSPTHKTAHTHTQIACRQSVGFVSVRELWSVSTLWLPWSRPSHYITHHKTLHGLTSTLREKQSERWEIERSMREKKEPSTHTHTAI